jgi:ABC-type glycerol-3-phosphate transport system substrate-binding protein
MGDETSIRSFTRRDFLRLGGGTLVGAYALGLSGCGGVNSESGQGGQGGKVTLKFMCDSRDEFAKMLDLLPRFTKETGIDVSLTQLQETPLRAKTGLELSAPETEMDVILMDFLLMKKYVDAGTLEPLNEHLQSISTFNESDYQQPFLDALTFDGNLYGLPLYQDCNILMYRADIFEKLGLDVPQNMEDLETVAKEITDWGKKDGVYGISLRGQRGMGVNEWTFPCFLRAFGGSYYADFPNDMHPVLDSPEAVAALEYYVNLVNNYAPPGVANYSYIEVQNDLIQGKSAMILDSATLGVRAVDPQESDVADKMGFAVVPEGPGGRHPGFYTWAVVVPAKAGNKEEAVEFLGWLLSPDTAPEVGWSAPNQALNKVYDYPPYEGYAQSQPLLEVMKQSLEQADPDYRPRIPQETEVGTEVSVAVSEAIAGNKTPEQALRDANERVDQVLREANYY